jgi:hypothetical protein
MSTEGWWLGSLFPENFDRWEIASSLRYGFILVVEYPPCHESRNFYASRNWFAEKNLDH